MNGFFGIGTGELMVIIAIAILVIGPKRLLEIAQTLGRLTRRGREIWNEVMKTIQAELQETKEAVEEVAESGSDLSAEIKATEKETSEALGGIDGKSKARAVDVQTEVKSIGQETQQIMKEVTEGFTSLVMGEEKSKEAVAKAEEGDSDQTPATQDKESEADKPLGGISG